MNTQVTRKFKAVAVATLISFGAISAAQPVMAAMVSTEQAMVQHQDRSELKQFFDRDNVVSALEKFGVSPEDAKARVDAMTDDEAARLASHIENAPAGAGIIGTLFTVFIILLVTDILGFTKVFPFTRSIR